MNNLMVERDYSVVKANDLIRNTTYDLSLVEQKIILRLIQLIKPQDTEFKTYILNINEFCALCGIEQNNGANYLYIKNSLKQLRDKSFWLRINGKERLCSWISKVILEDGSGDIEIRLDDDLKPFLLELKQNFTEYYLYYVLAMKSKYSIRMYEVLKSYKYLSKITVTIKELKSLLFAVHYDRFYDFKKNVISIAVEEINKYSDLIVTYDFNKQKKTVISINFKIRYKNIDEQMTMLVDVENRLDKD